MASSCPKLEAAARKFLENQGYRIQHPLEQAQTQKESPQEVLSQDVDGFRQVFQWAVGNASSEKSCFLLALVPIFVHLFFSLVEEHESKRAETFLTDHRLIAGIDASCQRIWDSLTSIKSRSQLEGDSLYIFFTKGHLMNLCIPEAAYETVHARLVSTRLALADIFIRHVRVVNTPDVSKARLFSEKSFDDEHLVNGTCLQLKVDAQNPPIAYGEHWKTIEGSDTTQHGPHTQIFSASNVERKGGFPLPETTSKQRRATSMHFTKLTEHRRELDMKHLPDAKVFMADVGECRDDVNCMTISNDGRRCVAGLRRARLWELDYQEDADQDAKRSRSNPSSKQPCAYHDLDGDQGRVLDASFTADTELLLTAGQDCAVHLWHCGKKRRLSIFSSGSCHQPIWSVDWSPLGHYFASSASKGIGFLWSVERSSPFRSFMRDGFSAPTDIEIVRAHPSGRYVSIVYSDQILLWDILIARPARILPLNDLVTALAFSADGTRILVGTNEGSLQPWDLLSGKPMRSPITAHRGPITSVGFSWPCRNSYDMAFSCGHDGFARFWSQELLGSSDNAGTEHEASLPLHGVRHSKQPPIVMNGAFTPGNDLLLACV